MLIIPAIDLYDGKCVRLYQGKLEQQTIFSENPLVVARQWVGLGARMLHLVDLNGAFEGKPANLDLVYEIAASVPVPVQVGGGIRSHELVAQILAKGAARVVLGTGAIKDRQWLSALAKDFPGRIVLGIDAHDGLVAVKGWTQLTSLKATELAAQVSSLPLAGIVFTDIQRDGTLKGPNLASLKEMLKATSLPLIASGGIGAESDIQRIVKKFPRGISGIIIGRALYTGALDLQLAIEKYQRVGAQ